MTLQTHRIAAFLALFLLSSLASAQVRYEIVLPEAAGQTINQTSVRGNEINENGETLLNRIDSFAVWSADETVEIVGVGAPPPEGARLSRMRATSLNDARQAVGSKTYLYRDADGSSRLSSTPFYWDQQNGLLELDALGERLADDTSSTQLYAINASGVALGTTQSPNGGNVAFLWSRETGRQDIAPLDRLDGVSETHPQALHDDGTVVGTYRKFSGTTSIYTERAFIYQPGETQPIDLATLDPWTFDGGHTTARDINATYQIIGERGRRAYFYELANGSSRVIYSPEGYLNATKAYALNDNSVVVGISESRNGAGRISYVPIIWTPTSQSRSLIPQLRTQLEAIIPQGTAIEDCQITPKKINNQAVISARLETKQNFAREIVLLPKLDLVWHQREVVTRNGHRGILFRHVKSRQPDNLSAATLGLEIALECSSDLTSWRPVTAENTAGYELKDTYGTVEVFLPFGDCQFVRPVLKTASSSADTSILGN